MIDHLPYVLAAWLLLVGLYGVATSRHFVHLVVSLSIAQASTYVLLLEVGYVQGGSAPIFKDVPSATRVVDPVVQALVLTDLVISVAVSGLLLAFIVQSHKRTNTTDPTAPQPLAG
ncbi:MAG TPA: cation:proton antiporter subunit C [Acidimicrobiia bacterium]|jgi:multicomponent Na+:H+ antiporter subunit C